MKNKLIVFVFALLWGVCLRSQNIHYARTIIDSLTSSKMHGRGYVDDGVNIAAKFIQNEFIKDNLSFFDSGYYQNLSYPINSITGKTLIKVGNKTLKPGRDYVIGSFSKGTKGAYKIVWFDKQNATNQEQLITLKKEDFSKKIIIVDKKGIEDKKLKELFDAIKYVNVFGAKAVAIIVEAKPSGSVLPADEAPSFASFDLARNCINKKSKKIKLEFKNQFFSDFKTKNVIGYVKGKSKSDSFVVFSAHYDHLGQMGDDAIFPGANDNASGISMMLDLANYYSKPENQPEFSIAFMAFTGEEVGLLGSKYYVEHPLFPLKNIIVEITLDMVGTGDDGIMIVNGAVYENDFKKFEKINNENNYLLKVSKRGAAANSDHHSFYEKGVKYFFIYTLGGISEYHNVYDKAETLPLTKYENLFRLITDYVKTK